MHGKLGKFANSGRGTQFGMIRLVLLDERTATRDPWLSGRAARLLRFRRMRPTVWGHWLSRSSVNLVGCPGRKAVRVVSRSVSGLCPGQRARQCRSRGWCRRCPGQGCPGFRVVPLYPSSCALPSYARLVGVYVVVMVESPAQHGQFGGRVPVGCRCFGPCSGRVQSRPSQTPAPVPQSRAHMSSAADNLPRRHGICDERGCAGAPGMSLV